MHFIQCSVIDLQDRLDIAGSMMVAMFFLQEGVMDYLPAALLTPPVVTLGGYCVVWLLGGLSFTLETPHHHAHHLPPCAATLPDNASGCTAALTRCHLPVQSQITQRCSFFARPTFRAAGDVFTFSCGLGNSKRYG